MKMFLLCLSFLSLNFALADYQDPKGETEVFYKTDSRIATVVIRGDAAKALYEGLKTSLQLNSNDNLIKFSQEKNMSCTHYPDKRGYACALLVERSSGNFVPQP